YSLTPGTNFTAFTVAAAGGRTFRFGVLICYEDSDADLARVYARPGGPDGDFRWLNWRNPIERGNRVSARPGGPDGAGPVDFLVNISNDGWFDGTEEHEVHLAICRFRAVECRRAVARAVNMGISAVIDPNGRVVALPADTWAGSKKVEAVVTAVVP